LEEQEGGWAEVVGGWVEVAGGWAEVVGGWVEVAAGEVVAAVVVAVAKMLQLKVQEISGYSRYYRCSIGSIKQLLRPQLIGNASMEF
jgi:hypothetical protein